MKDRLLALLDAQLTCNLEMIKLCAKIQDPEDRSRYLYRIEANMAAIEKSLRLLRDPAENAKQNI